MRGCDGRGTLLALVTAAAMSGGCVGRGEGVPTWAMHVRPAPVDHASTAEQVADRVARELASPELAPGHVPAEQLALIAIREIEQRQLADAGLWLSIADYRYFQQAVLARNKGIAQAGDLPADVNHNQFLKLVVAEIRLYGELGFDDELETINARLWGRSETEVAVQEQLMDLGKTAAVDCVSLRDAIAELRPAAATAATTTRYPKLAEAFRRRLTDDFGKDPKTWAAAYYLAQTPVAALRKDAVRMASRPFLRACAAPSPARSRCSARRSSTPSPIAARRSAPMPPRRWGWRRRRRRAPSSRPACRSRPTRRSSWCSRFRCFTTASPNTSRP